MEFTERELIDALAIEVMGWQRQGDNYDFYWQDVNLQRHSSNWSPLNYEYDLYDLLDRVKEIGYPVVDFFVEIMLEQSGRRTNNNANEVMFDAMCANSRKKCVAALEAVRKWTKLEEEEEREACK